MLPHGLGLSEAAPRVYAVVRDASAVRRVVTPPAESQARVEEVIVQTSRYTLAAEDIAPKDFLTQDQVQAMPRLADETLRAVQRLPGAATNGVSSIASSTSGAIGVVALLSR